MASAPDRLTKWTFIAQWFVWPIVLFAWLVARSLVYVLGFPMWKHPDGYIHISLIEPSRDFHDFVPAWLAYFYYCTSVLFIVGLVLVVLHRTAERDSP